MAFEVFTRSLLPVGRDPAVTIHKRGVLSLNGAAYVALGKPEAVEQLFDREGRIIGLKAADPTLAHCYFVRHTSRSANGPFLISAMAFLQHYDIQLPCSLRWRADLNQGILCVNLDSPATPTTSNRAKTSRAPDLSLVPNLVDNHPARHDEDDDHALGAATS